MAFRGPSLTYKIRKTTKNNKCGDNYGITIPRVIANKFEGVFFYIRVEDNSIIFESGCNPNLKIEKSFHEKNNKHYNIENTIVKFS
jgi:hypothetical protein